MCLNVIEVSGFFIPVLAGELIAYTPEKAGLMCDGSLNHFQEIDKECESGNIPDTQWGLGGDSGSVPVPWVVCCDLCETIGLNGTMLLFVCLFFNQFDLANFNSNEDIKILDYRYSLEVAASRGVVGRKTLYVVVHHLCSCYVLLTDTYF